MRRATIIAIVIAAAAASSAIAMPAPKNYTAVPPRAQKATCVTNCSDQGSFSNQGGRNTRCETHCY